MQREAKKEDRIRQAAVRVFSRKGFYKARAEEVAQEAGIAVGTIYNYFRNKDEILLSIFRTEFEERLSFFRELMKIDIPLPEKIRRILEEHFARLKKHKHMARLMMQERFNPGTGLRAKLLELYREMLTRVEELIQEGIEKNWIRPCHPKIVAQALLGVVESITVYALLHPDEENREVLKTAPNELADLIWNGLKKA